MTSKCSKVSGPVSVRAYDVPCGGGGSSGTNRVWIMGDEHFSYQNMCKPCDAQGVCCNVVSFVDDAVARAVAAGTQLDVLLELPYVPRGGDERVLAMRRWQRLMDSDRGSRLRKFKDGRKSRKSYLGMLAVLYHKYGWYVYDSGKGGTARRTGRKPSMAASNIRFHYADAREEPNVQAMLPLAPDRLLRKVRTCGQIRQLLGAFLFSDDFARSVAGLGLEPADPNALSALAPGGPRVAHKVAKQFLRVPQAAVGAAREYLDDRVGDAVEVLRADLGFDLGAGVLQRGMAAARQAAADTAAGRVPHMMHGVMPMWLQRVRGLHEQFFRRSYRSVMQLAVHLLIMDAYLLCRLLRYCCRPQAAGGECIVYAGNTHAEYYAEFFESYLGLRPVVCRPLQQVATVRRLSRMMPWDSNLSRCADIKGPPPPHGACQTVGRRPLSGDGV